MSTFVPVNGLHHIAYRCRDAEGNAPLLRRHTRPAADPRGAGRHGEHGRILPLHPPVLRDDGTAAAWPSSISATARAVEPWPDTPRWVHHLALRVDSEAKVDEAKKRLVAAGVDVLGPALHDGQFRSIYFFDPNGIRLEFTISTSTKEELQAFRRDARAACDDWSKQKAARLAVPA